MSTDSGAVLGRRCFGISSSKSHLRIASFCRRRPGTLVGSPIARYELGRSAFTTPFSTGMPLKAAQGRETGQGRKKTLKILNHGKNT
jgi:hypothetical protein